MSYIYITQNEGPGIMNLYKEKLEQHHLTKENAERVALAIKNLHYAFAQMDELQFSIFQWELPNIDTMLDDYARVEELRVLRISTVAKDDSEALNKFYKDKGKS
jgi:hypothetical protein